MNIASLFQGAAALGWIAAVGVVVLIFLQSARQHPMKRGTTLLLIVVILAIVLSSISAGLVFINPDERGVVISAIQSTGYRTTPLEPGLSWIIPFAENVVIYPISKQTYTMSIATYEGAVQGDDSIEARTADGQKVLVDASVIYAIDPAKVVDVHITWQDRYDRDLIRALSRGVIRDSVSQFGIEEVYGTKRLELVKGVTDVLVVKLSDNGLILHDFVLRNISFSEEYAASVEQKQIAEQQAQQAKFVVEQRKQEAQQARELAQGQADSEVIRAQGSAQSRLIQAEAEAAALQKISDAIVGRSDLLTYQYITKIAPNVEVMFLPSNAPFIFPLPEVGTGTGTATIPTE